MKYQQEQIGATKVIQLHSIFSRGRFNWQEGILDEALDLIETGVKLRYDNYTLESLANYYCKTGGY
ncbi:MAG: hypothetical protein U5L72_12100 [Bacteroidales bacterium]|nr:hypothetical protein [Bacteroidales bacterium]